MNDWPNNFTLTQKVVHRAIDTFFVLLILGYLTAGIIAIMVS